MCLIGFPKYLTWHRHLNQPYVCEFARRNWYSKGGENDSSSPKSGEKKLSGNSNDKASENETKEKKSDGTDLKDLTSRNLLNYHKVYDHPLKRAVGIVATDITEAYKNIKHTLKFKSAEKYSPIVSFPSHCDMLIIGGGIMGSQIAYHMQEFAQQALKIVVVERDLTYSKASTCLSCGGLRQQYSVPENIQLSKYGFDFLCDAKRLLTVPGESPPDIGVSFGGYLTLASEEGMDTLQNSYDIQKSYGTQSKLLSKEQLKRRFPWMNFEGIDGGIYGIHGECWFDPWALHLALIRKTKSLGMEFVNGEVIDSDYEELEYKLRRLNTVTVRLPDGQLREITFSRCILAAGAWSGEVGQILGVGKSTHEYLSKPLPVEPRKRFVYVFRSEDGPGLRCPFVIDPNGIYFRREGLSDMYMCGASVGKDEQEPSIEDLSVDHDVFEKRIWPSLAKRVNSFNSLKVTSSWAGYYDYNTFDQNGIVGAHPCYTNLFLATGFSGHGLQQAAAVGKALTELIIIGRYETINIERLGMQRYFMDKPLLEDYII